MATTTAAAKSKRPPPTRTTTRMKKKDDADELAQRLETKLKISEPTTTKPRRAAPAASSSKTRIPKPAATETNVSDKQLKDAMGAVNTVLQHLTTAVECKWTVSAAKREEDADAVSTTAALAVSARSSLKTIRKGGDGSARIDVEKAALGVLAKLVQTEMFNEAADIALDMRKPLCLLIGSSLGDNTSTGAPNTPSLLLLSLPTPSSGSPLDEQFQTIVIAYLQHTFVIATRLLATEPTKHCLFLEALFRAGSLTSWLSHLQQIPRKALDAALKRSYASVANSFCTPPATSNTLLSIRFAALRFLLLTSDLSAGSFWEQCLKFGVAHVKTNGMDGVDEKETVKDLLVAFSKIVATVDELRRTDLKTEKRWFDFCEYWISLAKRVRDRKLINEVTRLLNNSSEAIQSSRPTEEAAESLPQDAAVPIASSSKSCATEFDVRKACSTFTQTSDLLDLLGIEDVDDAELKQIIVTSTATLRSCATFSTADTPSLKPGGSKLLRSIEKLRRACLKALERSPVHGPVLRELIENIVQSYEQMIQTGEGTEAIVAALDTLFNLSSILLVPRDPKSIELVYAYLSKAASMIHAYNNRRKSANSDAKDRPVLIANYMRCTSGALFNAAGALYKAGKYGHAVRFLNDAAPLAVKALQEYDDANVETAEEGAKNEKDAETWRTHRLHLCKRYELLGACQCKLGNRKLAFDAFVQGVACYQLDSTFLEAVRLDSTKEIFLEHPQLAAMIDRLTYMGAAELFLDGETSLLHSLRSQPRTIPTLAIGAIIEHQKRSLEESKWKPKVQRVIACLLEDLLSLYDEEYPLRRARCLIWKIEAAYFSDEQETNVDVIAQDALEALADDDCRGDSGLSHTRLHYRATVHLWQALHAHRAQTADSATSIHRFAEDALNVLSQLAPPSSKAAIQRGAIKRVSDCISSVPKPRRVARPSQRAKRNGLMEIPVTPKAKRESLGVSNRPSLLEGANRVTHSTTFLDDVKTLLSLTHTVAQLLGLIGHVLAKIRLLHVLRRLCEKDKDRNAEDYMKASLALAYELARLGKFERAFSLYSSMSLGSKEYAQLAVCNVMLNLRHAEALAVSGNITKSVTLYDDARQLFETISFDEKAGSTSLRIRSRVQCLELSAMASVVFASIQFTKNDMVQALKGFLQALRLLNRAVESLARLNQPSTSNQREGTDPFAMSDLKEALPTTPPAGSHNVASGRTSLDGLEWRIGDALMHTMLLISRLYYKRGLAREAEYFAQQLGDLAKSLRSPGMMSRALASKGEVQLMLGQLKDAQETLSDAAALVDNVLGVDAAETRRLQGDHFLLAELTTDAQTMYSDAIRIIGDAGSALVSADVADRKSIGSPITPRTAQKKALVAPMVVASILRQYVWLLRDDSGDEYDKYLERLLALPSLPEIQVECNSLLGRLALHNIFSRFRQDLFLSSLAESTLAIPVGMTSDGKNVANSLTDILGALDHAEKLYSYGLDMFKEQGTVPHLRGAATSLALIKAFQASLGRSAKNVPATVVQLLDLSSSITITRELLDAIHYKLQNERVQHDTQWPSFSPTSEGPETLLAKLCDPFEDKSEDNLDTDKSINEYWETVLARHSAQVNLTQPMSTLAGINSLPVKWAIINISITEDKRALIASRQRSGREPLVFCIPLKGRRENDDDEQFTYEDAVGELKDIIQSSHECTRLAAHINSNDKEGKTAWWAERKGLDQRLQELLSNIEFCWLGAFKSILSQPLRVPPDVLTALRTSLEKVFKGILGKHEKRHKGKFKLDDSLLECLACLGPSCKDEEIEDLIYFVLDLYHFQGVPIALAEVDVDVVTVDLRTAFEEHNARARNRILPENDAHIFLVLDKHVQGIPWESLPILRGCSVSRIPNTAFLLDRIDLARFHRGEDLTQTIEGQRSVDRVELNPSSGFFMLNPSGDLGGTEDRFKKWAADMKSAGWEGITGKKPSEQQLVNALSRKELVIYFGHGGAEQYIRSHKIRHLKRCAATMLWGCSSGALREMGEFDRVGTPYSYMLAGCPTLVANLWDVTDRDIDKFALSVFDKLHLHGKDVKQWQNGQERPRDEKTSVVTAVAQSRDVCKLKYLTGAAPVVYGIPFYL